MHEWGASARASGGIAEESSKERNSVFWKSQTHPQGQVQDEGITEDALVLFRRETSVRQLEADIMDIMNFLRSGNDNS